MEQLAANWLKSLNQLFVKAGFRLYLVGGALRDQKLGRPIKEWDLASDAKPIEIESILRKAKARKIGTIGQRFGTITATFHGESVEITTFRGEHYFESSRQPAVSWGKNIKEDLSRRDFTINALALDLGSSELLDPYEGQTDLKNKLIRAVGNPIERYNEDPLRMLRAIRFASELGFRIEPETLEAISQKRERFAILSAERVAVELDRILLSEKPSTGIRLLVETGLIAYVLPELIPTIDLEFDPKEHKDIYEHILTVLDNTPAKLELRWCALLHDIAKPLTRQKTGGEYSFHGHENLGSRLSRAVLTRLRYPNDFIKYVVHLVRLHQRLPNNTGNWSDGAIRRFVRDANTALDDLFTFAEADATSGNQQKLKRYRDRRLLLRERIAKLERQAEIAKIKSPLDGHELMKLFNRPAGPWLKVVKQHLLDQVLEGNLAPDDKSQAAKIARRFLSNR